MQKVQKVTHRPPLTPHVLLGYFDDDAIISALTRLSTDPKIPVILAQAVLHVWTAYGGVKSPSAFDIAMYFEPERVVQSHGRTVEQDRPRPSVLA